MLSDIAVGMPYPMQECTHWYSPQHTACTIPVEEELASDSPALPQIHSHMHKKKVMWNSNTAH